MLTRILRLILLILTTIVIVVGRADHPSAAIATDATAPMARVTAPVVLDGRELFELGDAGPFSARERAQRVEIGLRQFLRSPSPNPEVITAALNGNDTIRLSDRHLLTVTDSDIEPGLTTTEQAEIWRDLLIVELQRAFEERQPDYVQDQQLKAFQILGIAAILYLLSWELDVILRRRLHSNDGKSSPSELVPSEADRIRHTLLHLALLAAQGLGWLITLYYTAGLFPQSRQWRYNFIANFTRPILLLGDRYSSILELVLLLTMLVGLWFSVIWVTDRFRAQVLSVTGADRSIQDITIVLGRFVLLFVGLSIVLQIWGIDIASLAVLISALSVGIGFGLQNIANNFISGIIISFDRSMKVGDFIQLNDLMGTVERIGTRSTELRTLDHVSIVVPNSRFLEEALVNWNHGNPVSRIGIPVGVAYGSDSDRVRTALLEVARNYEPLLSAPEPQVWFRSFGDSALNFELLVWIRDPQNQFKYISELNYRIYDALARYNIEIPFPQQDLHLKSVQLDAAIETLGLKDSTTSTPEPKIDREA
jgi:potassium-dependent mechanosensitive channel